MLQTTPMIRKVSEHLGAPVDVYISNPNPFAISLFGRAPWVNIVYPRASLIEGKHYHSAFITGSAGAVIPPLNVDNLFVQRRRYRMMKECRRIHETAYNFMGLEELFPNLVVSEEEQSRYFVSDFAYSFPDNKVVGLCNGRKPGIWERRSWDGFTELAGQLQEQGYEVHSFGTEDEYIEGTVNKTGTTLRQNLIDLTACSYFVASDGGIFHMAEALGIPTIALFGPTSVIKNGPISTRTRIVHLKKECSPCNWKVDFHRCTNNVCMKEVTVQHVLDELECLEQQCSADSSAEQTEIATKRGRESLQKVLEHEGIHSLVGYKDEYRAAYMDESFSVYLDDERFYAAMIQGAIKGLQFDRARAIHSRAVSLFPESKTLRRMLATIEFEFGDYDESERVLLELLESFPDDVKIFQIYLNTLIKQGRFEDVLSCKPSGIDEGSTLYSDIYRLKGIAARNLYDWPTAIEYFQKSLFLKPDVGKVEKELEKALFAQRIIGSADQPVIDESPLAVLLYSDGDLEQTQERVLGLIGQNCPRITSIVIGVTKRYERKELERHFSGYDEVSVKRVDEGSHPIFQLASAVKEPLVVWLKTNEVLPEGIFEEMLLSFTDGVGYLSVESQEQSIGFQLDSLPYRVPPVLLFRRDLIRLAHGNRSNSQDDLLLYRELVRYARGETLATIALKDNRQPLTDAQLVELEQYRSHVDEITRKVFLVSRHGYPPFGGGEQFLMTLVSLYKKKGYEPIIVGLKGHKQGRTDAFRYISVPQEQSEIRELFLKEQPALVHAITGAGYDLLFAARDLNVSCIYGTHFWRDITQYKSISETFLEDQKTLAQPKPEFNYILRNAKVVYSNSEFVREVKRAHFDMFSPLMFSLVDYSGTSFESIEVAQSKPYVFLSNTHKDKGYGLLLDLAEALPEIPFFALASQTSREEALSEIRQRNLENVTIGGWTKDMGAVYRGARVTMVPGFESFSRVVIESHHCGVPVIGGTIGNVPYLLKQSGRSIDPNDIDEWASEIKRLYQDDEYYRSRIRLARENAIRYSFSQQTNRIDKFLSFVEEPVLLAVAGSPEEISSSLTSFEREYPEVVYDIVVETTDWERLFEESMEFGSRVNMVMKDAEYVRNRRYQKVYAGSRFRAINRDPEQFNAYLVESF